MFWKFCGFIGWLAFTLSPVLPYLWFLSLRNPSLTQMVQAIGVMAAMLQVVVWAWVATYRARKPQFLEAGA